MIITVVQKNLLVQPEDLTASQVTSLLRRHLKASSPLLVFALRSNDTDFTDLIMTLVNCAKTVTTSWTAAHICLRVKQLLSIALDMANPLGAIATVSSLLYTILFDNTDHNLHMALISNSNVINLLMDAFWIAASKTATPDYDAWNGFTLQLAR